MAWEDNGTQEALRKYGGSSGHGTGIGMRRYPGSSSAIWRILRAKYEKTTVPEKLFGNTEDLLSKGLAWQDDGILVREDDGSLKHLQSKVLSKGDDGIP